MQGMVELIDLFVSLPHPIQALVATLFTWAITSLGSALVFAFRQTNRDLMDAMLGAAAGVMMAASFWSLLSPAIEIASSVGLNPWATALVGFFGGGALLFAGDRVFSAMDKGEEGQDGRKRCLMLILSITLHNIPEGMVVGVAFGSLGYGVEGTTLSSALMLALGIGLQNFPEGTAVSLPLLREGYSRKSAFLIGQLSGIVEPIAGVAGALLVMKAQLLLPYLLAFAAGAMIYVVVEELIPESQGNGKKNIMALFTLLGFGVMMVMDVALQ